MSDETEVFENSEEKDVLLTQADAVEEPMAGKGGAGARAIKKKRRTRGDLIFYCLLLAYPIIQFCIFYVATKFNAVLYSFQEIDIANDTVTWTFKNVKKAFNMLTSSGSLGFAMVNSIKTYFLLLFISTPISLIFSYYIAKKFPGSGVFRVILFLPAIISSVITIAIYTFFVERAFPELMSSLFNVEMLGLLESNDTRYGAIIFYTIAFGFGSGVLIYANEMSSVPQEVIESAQLDGSTPIKEFFHIVLPLIIPTMSTFLITGMAGIFTNTLGLFLFYGDLAPDNVKTIGYDIFVRVRKASSEAQYPLISAMGLLLTFVTITLTMLLRWALEKLDPNRD